MVGKIPLEKGTGYPLQLSGLENSMDCTVHEVAKSQTRLSDFHFRFTFTVFLPGKSHGQRSPQATVHCSPWGRKGSDTT